MVVIRLARGGAKKRPHYNLVVADSRYARDGRHVERVGYYNPMAAAGEKSKGTDLHVDVARYEHWLKVGAQPSPTVRRLVRQKLRSLTTSPAPVSS